MISLIISLFKWPIDDTKFLLLVDSVIFYVAIGVLFISFLINTTKLILIREQNYKIKFIKYTKIGKILIHVLIFIGLIFRAGYLMDKVQMDPFTQTDAIFPVYTLLYTIIRIILFSYLIIIVANIFRGLDFCLKRIMLKTLNK